MAGPCRHGLSWAAGPLVFPLALPGPLEPTTQPLLGPLASRRRTPTTHSRESRLCCTARGRARCPRGPCVDQESGPVPASRTEGQDSYGWATSRVISGWVRFTPHVSWDTLTWAPSAPGHAGKLRPRSPGNVVQATELWPRGSEGHGARPSRCALGNSGAAVTAAGGWLLERVQGGCEF